jgi:SAM-dependent methyltransferase
LPAWNRFAILLPMTASHPAPGASTAARAFSRAAALYDAEHAANPLARWTRRRSLAALERAFAADARLLELGCGAGAEALHLAARGASIVATDAAPGMVAALAAKLAPGGGAAGLAGRVTPLVLPAARVGELVARYGPAAFDGAYSSFGPLNCEPDLAPVAAGLAALVRPGGRLVLSLINRFCLWETAWYLRAGQPGRAFRRWPGHATATVRAAWQDERIPVFYWTPGAVEAAFRPHFRAVRRMGLPWLLPPQYLDGLVPRAPGLFRRLARWDRRLAAAWPCYAIGDHALITLVRVADGPGR